jgi:uncharacterized protein YegJ (DUF2314 family)
MRHSFIIVVLVLVPFLSCDSSLKEKIVRDGEPDVIQLTEDDREMNHAIQTARDLFPIFLSAIQSQDSSGFHSFRIKMRFEHSEGGEHIWVDQVSLVSGELVGVIGNDPVSVENIKMGDTVKISQNRVSDWMFFNGDNIEGGFSVKLLRKRMTPEERTQFDLETDNAFR